MADKPKSAEVYLSPDDPLIEALRKFTSTKAAPKYLKDAAEPYLVKR